MNDTLLLKDDEFTIWQPSCVSVVKSASADDRRIGGYCSTEHLDRQGEVVLQKGLDFEEFVKYGYFNDNHNQATAAVVGIPEHAEYHPGKGWYTEGKILKGMKRADEIWELAKSLENTPRRLGFSIEGKVIERRDNYIVKARIRNVAVTNAPVNTNCSWSLLAKSYHPDLESEAAKALGVGHERVAPIGELKSGMDAGRVVVPEDLEHDACKCPDCGKHSKKTRKSVVLSESESIALIQRVRPHYSEALCRKIYNYVAGKGV